MPDTRRQASDIWYQALSDYLAVENQYNRKYQIVCGVKNPSRYKDRIIQNFSFVQKAMVFPPKPSFLSPHIRREVSVRRNQGKNIVPKYVLLAPCFSLIFPESASPASRYQTSEGGHRSLYMQVYCNGVAFAIP